MAAMTRMHRSMVVEHEIKNGTVLPGVYRLLLYVMVSLSNHDSRGDVRQTPDITASGRFFNTLSDNG